MASIPELIYCAAGNRKFAEIAIETGFRYGAQMPGTVYFPLFFCDQNWKKPNREKYMAALAQHRPHMASVLDLEREEQLTEVLDWAEEAAQFVEVVMIIPKAQGIIQKLPCIIGSKQVRLGYSVPTRHGGTELPSWDFAGRPLHLLGGSPHAQMRIYSYLRCVADVVSADGNYTQKMAVQYNQFWTPGTATYAKNRYWPRLDEYGDTVDKDAPYKAFELSCQNILNAWQSVFK